ncbi:hypothetical protein SBA6_740021 [Candidatus Sulfopaludibacter sp. SbA6]|nr:hypothetical protein SBA6_740021 [Candidatus Sulfopaludibacter sp. SbA6]
MIAIVGIRNNPRESGYQKVAIVRLQEILDAIGIRSAITLSA